MGTIQAFKIQLENGFRVTGVYASTQTKQVEMEESVEKSLKENGNNYLL